jgi:hypothetical protein
MAVGHLFLMFNLLDGSFSFNCRRKELQVALLFGELSLFSQPFLLLIVFKKTQISFPIQDLAFPLNLSLLLLVQGPLSLKHLTFDCSQIFVLISVHFTCLLLPFEHGKSVSCKCFLFLGLLNLAFKFLLSVKLIQLGVDLLFHHLLLNITSLINKLLFSFNLSSHNIKLSVLLPKRVVLHFKLLVKTSLHLGLAF